MPEETVSSNRRRRCSCCGNLHHNEEMRVTTDSHSLCRECYDDFTITCNECGNGMARTVEIDNGMYCRPCSESINTYQCRHCENRFREENILGSHQQYFCRPCLDEVVRECGNCSRSIYTYDERYHTYDCGAIICNHCLHQGNFGELILNDHSHSVCAGCGNTACNRPMNFDENVKLYYCSNCFQNRPKFFKSQSFRANKSRRFVGVEIEHIFLHEYVPSRRPAGVSSDESLPFCLYPPEIGYCKDDGSLRPGEHDVGVEFVLNPANGDTLFKNIRTVSEFMRKNECYVNRSCGLHVHIDVSQTNEAERRNVFRAWAALEGLLFAAFSEMRSGNQYCSPVGTDRNRCEPNYDNDHRYGALNVAAFYRHRTFEVRVHEGTVDADKIIQWVKFLLAFFETFEKIELSPERYQEIRRMNMRQKVLFLFQQVKLPLELKKYFVKRLRHYGRTRLNKPRQAA